MIHPQAAGSLCTSELIGSMTPALLTKMSIFPSRWLVSSTIV